MKFSLIMATVGRKEEVGAFLESLKQQTYRDFELIIVDQNERDVLGKLIETYKEYFLIKHIRSSVKGLSVARNRGLKEATGDVMAFPDDDCLYSENLLSGCYAFLKKQANVDAISIAWHDSLSGKRIKNFGKNAGEVNRLNIWTQVSSITLFIKKQVFNKIQGFDETLGIGPHSVWKGAEDKDLPLRLLGAGFYMYYVPHIVVYHPAPVIITKTLNDHQKQELLHKTFIYSAAAGYVMKKHHYPLSLKFGAICVGIAKTILCLIMFKPFIVKIRIASLKGRIYGFLS